MIDHAFDLFGASAPVAVLGLLAALTAVWLWAEFRARVVARLALGLALCGLVAYSAYYVGWLGPQYTITYYDSAVRQSADALSQGRVGEVEEAFSEYARQPVPHPLTILSKLESARSNK
jgi:hypothetical protein